MTLDEAIRHCEEVAEKLEKKANIYEIKNTYLPDSQKPVDCLPCAADHRQLAEWLRELKELSLQQNAPRLGSIEEYHFELARCKTAFWSCNKRCMDAEEQYRRKVEELKIAQEQISEYKRLLKAAVEDLAKIPCNNDVYIPSSCDACIKQGNCDYSDSFKWRYTDEALKLLNEEI